MKVRIGFGLGTATACHDERLGDLAEVLESLGFDSLWLSERVGATAPDPVVGLGFAAGRTRRLKLGTSVLVLPGRNPVLLAKALASLDRLSGGRLLPAVGLGVADPHEQQAFGVDRADRAAWFDEALPLLRRLWTEEAVTHHGPRFRLDGVRVEPKPVQQPIDVWLGGIAPAELRRVGRLGDGWLPSFVTPEEAAAGREVVEGAATACGRAIDPEHWGALVPYATGPLPGPLRDALARRRPGADPTALVAEGLAALRDRLGRFVAHGFSKLVVVPLTDPPDWPAHVAAVADAVLDLQTGGRS